MNVMAGEQQRWRGMETIARRATMFLEQVLGMLGGVILFLLLCLVLVSVAERYIASSSISGADELAIWLHVALVFICFPLISGSNLAMRLDFLPNLLGARGQAACCVLSDTVVVHASLVLLSGGLSVIELVGGYSAVLGLPEWLRFIPVAVGGGLSAVMVLLRNGSERRWLVGVLAIVLGTALWGATRYASFETFVMPSAIAGGTAFLALCLGAPLPHALLSGLSLSIAGGGQLPEPAIVQNAVSGIGKFLLLAIPFFLLAGVLMNVGGLAQRLVQFAASLVGHFRGGLAQTTLVTNLFFSGISGSSIADAAFGAKVLVPALVSHGYKPERAAAIVAATAVLPNIIPPSIAFLMLASVTNLSVGALFTGGLVAGLVLAVMLAAALYLMSRKMSERPHRASVFERWQAFCTALPALGLALIILGGIRFGIVTTTEAAALAGLYSLLVALWIRGAGNIRVIAAAFVQTAKEASAVGLLIGASAPFIFLLAIDDLPQAMQHLFASLESPVQVILLANGILLLVGCFLDIGAAILLLAPLLMPAAIASGIDPIHFGVILVVNLMIHGLVPPLGILVHVASRLSGLSAMDVFRSVLPLVGALLVGLAIISVFAAVWAIK